METSTEKKQSLSNGWYAKAATVVGAGTVITGIAPDANAAVVSWPSSGLTATTSPNFVYFDFATGQSSTSSFAGYDFRITRNTVTPNVFAQIFAATGNGGQALGTFTGGYAYPTRLVSGSPIGPAGSFFIGGTGNNLMTLAASPEATYPRGNWDGPNIGTAGFVGLRFGSPGAYNYAWVEVTVAPNMNLTLGRFAYETTLNTPINVVPEVNSLSLLALGGAGLALHRRRIRAKAPVA